MFMMVHLLSAISMNYNQIHDFHLTPLQMKEIQSTLKRKITLRPYQGNLQVVAGVDVAYQGTQGVAVIVVMDYPSKEILETVCYEEKVATDYIPGLLAFRELPLILKAWEQLTISPDLVFFDGNGILHPRQMGIATHASFFIDRPTIGVAKSHFIGSYDSPAQRQGSYSPIIDQGETIGAVLRTQTAVKPVYVSIGNRVTLQQAIDFTMQLVGTESRVPEIIRQADIRTRQFWREKG